MHAITEKVYQYIIYLLLKPEWLPKLESLFKINKDKDFSCTIKKINHFFTSCINHENKIISIYNQKLRRDSKYLDEKYLIKKLNTLQIFKTKILHWLYNEYFIEEKSEDNHIYKKNICYYDSLQELLEAILNTGIEWHVYNKWNNDNYFFYNVVLCNKKINHYYFNYCETTKSHQLSNCFLYSVGLNLLNYEHLIQKRNFCVTKFKDIQIIIKYIVNKYQINTILSMESIQKLVYKIKRLLYHRNYSSYWRANSHLLLKEARTLILNSLLIWHKYYHNILTTNLIQYISKNINYIVYRWQLKK